MQRIIDNHVRFQQYLAFEEALREGDIPEHAAERAVDLLYKTSGLAKAETIRKNHVRVRRALESGRACEFWYPASLGLRKLIEMSFDLPVHSSFVPFRG
jgi:hypothetical protein